MLKKLLIALPVVVLVALFFVFDLHQYLEFSYLKTKQGELKDFYTDNKLLTVLSYFAMYVLITACSLPGALVMTIAGGVIFGLGLGVVIVSFASTIGATLAFLLARYLLRDFVRRKFNQMFQAIDAGMQRDGLFYLVTLRLVPLFPFFMVNLAMGLTKIRVGVFFVVSQASMLLGTLLYVNAGAQLTTITAASDIVSAPILLSFTLLGIFPLLAKKIIDTVNARRIMRPFKRPAHYDYNLIVIGAGSAGLVSSYIAATVQARVLLLERERMGGDCLNTGCVPSKALIKSAKIAHLANKAHAYGLQTIDIRYDFADVMERVQRVIGKIAPHDSVERYQKLGVDCQQGEAKITSPYSVELTGQRITTRKIIVATGAKPFVPTLPGLEQVAHYTTDNIWELRTQPKRLLVLGGGAIGCELAQAFARLGSQVTQIELGERLLAKEDPDVSAYVTKVFADEGIVVHTEHRAIRFETAAANNGGTSSLVCEHQGQEKRFAFDAVLLALGRKPHIGAVCGEGMQFATQTSGALAVNTYLQTNYPNIYACGDVIGSYQFTHASAHEAWYCAVNSLFAPIRLKVNYQIMPWCTFTDPEVARVGLNATDATAQGINFKTTIYELSDLDRAITDEEDHGFVKVLTVPKKDKILGATIVGTNAGELINTYVHAMKNGIGLNRILGTIHAYPTYSEANKYLAGNWKRAHAPEKLLGYCGRYFQWRRR
ncbi:MAG: FAD-dependent oxidoreductase [Pseudomonadota bacterium]|nr:FAD-dependent oxidoreductase [Pseudomonadota bacterium]